MHDAYDVVVVGAGMAGLTCGAWLTLQGMRVAVVEQNDRVGGLCSSYRRGPFNFTVAASEITGTTPDGIVSRVLRALALDRDVAFLPLAQGYHVHFPDFDYYIYSGSPDARERFIEQFLRRFPAEAGGIKGFFAELVRINEQADYATFLGTGPRDILRIMIKCPALVRHMGKSIAQFMDGFVRDPRLRAALSINATCANLPPSRMAAAGIAGLLIEGSRSIPHIQGGAQALPEAFARYIRTHGGDVLTGKRVQRILIRGNVACAVQFSPAVPDADAAADRRREVRARYVVSTASARLTFGELIGPGDAPAAYRRRLARYAVTPPLCALLLGIDCDLHAMGFAPALHIFTATDDTEAHFRDLVPRLLDQRGPEPFFRLQLANLSDPSSAPQGKTALVVHAIPAPVDGWENPDFERRIADALLRRVEKKIPGLSRHIEYQEFWSPRTFDRYMMTGPDASIGWALTPQQLGPRRLAQTTPVRNLLLAGHWTRPALGIIGVVVSGLQAARMILQREGVAEPLAAIGIRGGIRVG